MLIHIGKKIKEIADAKSITVRMLSEGMGVSEAMIYKMFKQEHMNTENLVKMSDLLGVPVSFFFENHPHTAIHLQQGIGVNRGVAWQHFGTVAECEKELEKALLEISYLKRENELLRELTKK